VTRSTRSPRLAGQKPLRAVYSAAGPPAQRAELERFLRWCDAVGLPELSRLARTVHAWQVAILA
jgi:hypothetical protein